MSFEPHLAIHQQPIEIGRDTFLIRSVQPAFGAPLSVNLNSLVIRAAEPVIVDTGTIANRENWLNDVFSLVDPAEVRWVFLSHDDDDHTGNLAEVMERCPAATLVCTWAMTERMGSAFGIPPERIRWVDDSGVLDVGDRKLLVRQPPVYDSPTTRALFDPATGVLWASDAFATPMPSEPVDRVDELPPPMWAEGFAMFHHHALAPWLSIVDQDRYAERVAAFRAFDPTVIAAAHTPMIGTNSVGDAFEHLAALPTTVPPPHPDQQALEAILAGQAGEPTPA